MTEPVPGQPSTPPGPPEPGTASRPAPGAESNAGAGGGPDRPVQSTAADPGAAPGGEPARDAPGAGGEPAREAPGAAGEPGGEAGEDLDALPALEAADPFEELARERDDFRDALVRLQADFENYKKRVAKQQDDLRERAAVSLVEKLLPVLDTADLALAHGGGEDVKQVYTSLFSTLEREGLERMDEPGCAFDPTLHDAVAHEPGEGGAQEVAEVMRAGYRWRGRVLRAAMVKVRG